MGYTTEFRGRFELHPSLSHEQWLEIGDLSEKRGGDTPDSYCQWVPSREGDALVWDGGEKFYYYADWLQWIIDNKLKPWGINIAGAVTWQGEEVGDVGRLEVVDGKAVATKIDLTGVELTEHEIVDAVESYRPSEFAARFKVVRR